MVVCKSCGYKGDNGKFCPQCGTPLEESVPEFVVEEVQEEKEPESATETQVAAKPEKEKAPKKPLNKKLIATIAVVAIVVIAAITLLRMFTGGKSGFDTLGDDAVNFMQTEEAIKIFTADGKMIEGPECDYYSGEAISMDSSKVILISDDEELYLLTKKGFVEIDSDVANAKISTTGAGIAYIKDCDDYDNGCGDLYVYDVEKEKSTKIESGVFASGYVISPDGKTVAFIDDNERCHLFVKGEEQGDGVKGAKPLAVSNGGKYLYYGKNDNIYVLPKKKDAEKLASSADQIVFNKDFTQMMYSYNGKTYFCNEGKEADETVTTKGSCRVVVPTNGLYQSYTASIYDYSSVSVTVLGTEKLSNLVCRIDDGLYYITKDMVAEKIVSSYNTAQVSEDGNSLIYYKGEDLYKVKNLKKSLEAEEIASDLYMRSFNATPDLSKVYYYDTEEEEIVVFNGKKTVTIYDDDYSGMVVAGNNLYFLGDYDDDEEVGTLYVSKDGKEKQKVSSSDEVNGMVLMNGKVFYYVEEDDELFMADGTKEKSVAKEFSE